MAICIECEEKYSSKRRALGYRTCLDCGDKSARQIHRARTAATLRAMTPNHYEGPVEEMFDKHPE